MTRSRGVGSHPAGDDHPRARLTSQRVAEARRRVAAGEAVTALAAEFRLAARTLSDAVVGVTWRSVTDPPPIGERLRRWSTQELAILAGAADTAAPAVATALGRTPHAIRQQRSKRRA